MFGWLLGRDTARVLAALSRRAARRPGCRRRGRRREPVEGGGGTSGWSTYIAVADAEAAAARVTSSGGRVLSGPFDVGEAGRAAACVDPSGVAFRLWQAGRRLGAQAVNSPGSWNFSDLHAADPAASAGFYSEVFGWPCRISGSPR